MKDAVALCEELQKSPIKMYFKGEHDLRTMSSRIDRLLRHVSLKLLVGAGDDAHSAKAAAGAGSRRPMESLQDTAEKERQREAARTLDCAMDAMTMLAELGATQPSLVGQT